jgi:hypothetical protein
MHERVQIEAAEAIARQEHAPPGPEVQAVGPILGDIRSAWVLAPRLQHDKVETSPQVTVCVHEVPIAEPGACDRGPFDDPITVRPHFSDDFLDLRDPVLVLLCKAPALVSVQRHLVPALGLLGFHELILKAQMRLICLLELLHPSRLDGASKHILDKRLR